MKPRVKLLAVIGSQRKDGNSYLLAKTVLESAGADYEIIQLAEKEIRFCDLCERCASSECALEDDFNFILGKMREAEGIVFAVPKYIFLASKFLAFLERLDTIHHMREHEGYRITFKNPEYRLFSKEKPFCVLTVSGTGNVERETMEIVTDCIRNLGLKLVPYALPPFCGVSIKGGDGKGEVLKNEDGIADCKNLVRKLIETI